MVPHGVYCSVADRLNIVKIFFDFKRGVVKLGKLQHIVDDGVDKLAVHCQA